MRSMAVWSRWRGAGQPLNTGLARVRFILRRDIGHGGFAENDAAREVDQFRLVLHAVTFQESVDAFDGGPGPSLRCGPGWSGIVGYHF